MQSIAANIEKVLFYSTFRLSHK